MSKVSLIEASQSAILRESSYYRMDKLVWEMRQAKSGLEMKIQKTFFSSIPNACTGKELVQWLKVKLLTPTETEALHLANALYRLGYIVPVNERQASVKLDNSCYRIQRPALWPSRKWDCSSQEYAIYLLKKQEKGKSLESGEQVHLSALSQTHEASWSKLKNSAKDAVSKYNRGSKSDKDIEDSQDRSFWRVHRPSSGQRTHHYSSNGFTKNSICMEAINQNRKTDILNKKIEFMTLYLERSQHHSENTREKTITILKNHCVNYQEHDPLICRRDATNPWIAIDEYFYEDLLELEEKKHTRLDLESWMLSFKELMKDSYGKGLFATFLEREYSLENLYFWEACEDLKQSSQYKVPVKMDRIRRDFLESSSRYEVNLDRQVLQATIDEMNTPSRYCMDKAQRHIYNLMKDDCYPRFLKSDMYRDLLLALTDKRRTDRVDRQDPRDKDKDRVVFLKKLYQRKDRKASVSSTSAKIFSKHTSKDAANANKTKYFSSSDLQSSHASVSPYYMRRASHASPAVLHRALVPDTEFAIRKAGSLSSLVVVNTNRKKPVAAKVTFDDEVDRMSDDSGTYSGVYCTATYSAKSGNKKPSLRKKYSFS